MQTALLMTTELKAARSLFWTNTRKGSRVAKSRRTDRAVVHLGVEIGSVEGAIGIFCEEYRRGIVFVAI